MIVLALSAWADPGPTELAEAFLKAAAGGDLESAVARCAPAFRERDSMSCRGLVEALPRMKATLGQVDANEQVARVHLDMLSGGIPFVIWLRAERSDEGWRFTDAIDLDGGDPTKLVPELPYARPALAGGVLKRLLADPQGTCAPAAREVCVALSQLSEVRALAAHEGRKETVLVLSATGRPGPGFVYVRRKSGLVTAIDEDEAHAAKAAR